jgi:tRNA(Ile)-lysidine synthase
VCVPRLYNLSSRLHNRIILQSKINLQPTTAFFPKTQSSKYMISHEVFYRALTHYFPKKLPKKVAVALSGGVDSLCLTFLLKQYRDIYQPDLEIYTITIDHKYREGSYEEAQQIGEIVKKWNINHSIQQLNYDRKVKDITNFEEVARIKRYEKFYEYCSRNDIHSLFVGHNLNDQLETFIQRLQQNSSIFGLIGLKGKGNLPLNDKIEAVHVYRPLLEFEKSEIIRTCREQKVQWFEDSTNQDIGLTRRNFMRYLLSDIIPKGEIQRNDIRHENLKLNNSYPRDQNSLSIISKESLIQTHEEIVSLTNLLLEKSYNLYSLLNSSGMIEFHNENASMTIKIPNFIINKENSLVLSRFLYIVLYSISSVKHYHWSYGKVERQLVPKLIEYVNRGNEKIEKVVVDEDLQTPNLTQCTQLCEEPSSSPIRLTYLNLMFTCIQDKSYMCLDIQRQPMLRDHDVSFEITISSNWSDWKLYDRRYWLRLCSNSSISVKVVPYDHGSHREFLHPLILNKISLLKKMNGVPVLLHDSHIISIPTYNVNIPDVKVEWRLKNNIWLNDLKERFENIRNESTLEGDATIE